MDGVVGVFEAVEPAVFAEEGAADKGVFEAETLPFGMEIGAATIGTPQGVGVVIIITIRTTEKGIKESHSQEFLRGEGAWRRAGSRRRRMFLRLFHVPCGLNTL